MLRRYDINVISNTSCGNGNRVGQGVNVVAQRNQSVCVIFAFNRDLSLTASVQ